MKFIFSLVLIAGILAVGCGKTSVTSATPVTLDELNGDLSLIMMHNAGRFPDTNQINAFLSAMGKSFPTAPPGKKIVPDPVAKQFVIVDQ